MFRMKAKTCEQKISRNKKKRQIKKRKKKGEGLFVFPNVPDCFYRKDTDRGCDEDRKRE